MPVDGGHPFEGLRIEETGSDERNGQPRLSHTRRWQKAVENPLTERPRHGY